MVLKIRNKKKMERREEYVINYIQKTRYTLEECVETLSQTLGLTKSAIWYIISQSAQKAILCQQKNLQHLQQDSQEQEQ